MTSISHPYSSLFTTFPLFFLYSALPHGLRRRKKVNRSADDHRRREKRGVERCISTPIPNHLSTLISTSMPNHLSTLKKYQSTPSISHPYSLLFTTFTPSNLKTTTLHQSGEEKRGVEVKKRVAARRKWVKRSAERHGRRKE